MLKNHKNSIYKKALQKWGDLQLIIAIEEFAELQKELTKYLRYGDNQTLILEEIADVEIMIEQLKIKFDNNNDVERIKNFKIKKLEKLLIIKEQK